MMSKLNDFKKTQEMIVASERRFWAVAQSASDAIISADGSGVITFWNRGAEKMFGYTEAEAVGQSLKIIIPPSFQPLHDAGMRRIQETGEKRVIGRTVELSALHKDGTQFPVELSLSRWVTLDGLTHYSAIVRDITERKQAEDVLRAYAEELEARNQELHAYDRTIAHDLKAPLGVISTYSQLLRHQFEGNLPEKAVDYLEKIAASTQQMTHMIDQLLTLAMVRDEDAQPGAIAMLPVVTAAVNRFHDRIEAEGIRVDIAPDLPDALGHPMWVEAVFSNLIGNAIKYKGQHNPAPHIGIKGEVVDGHVRFDVRDNGLGIPPDAQARLFEMFTRVHPGEAEGFGLGLSIVHRVVTRMGGQVGVESQPGAGSRFWFTLPAPQ